MDKNSHTNSLVNFPSEIDKNDNLRFYDESSLENHLAILSHYLHNPSFNLSDDNKIALMASILNFLDSKSIVTSSKKNEYNIDESFLATLNEPEQLSLFSDFFKVPFPNPMSAKFTFIDLFAGIGGIRLPFSELGYKCVFSSEWDKYAQKTYLSNFGEMPFGDICRI